MLFHSSCRGPCVPSSVFEKYLLGLEWCPGPWAIMLKYCWATRIRDAYTSTLEHWCEHRSCQLKAALPGSLSQTCGPWVTTPETMQRPSKSSIGNILAKKNYRSLKHPDCFATPRIISVYFMVAVMLALRCKHWDLSGSMSSYKTVLSALKITLTL